METIHWLMAIGGAALIGMVAQRNFTPAPPMSDALGDDIAADIIGMVMKAIEPLLPRMGTVTSISGEHAQVSVQRWDEEAGGQQFRPRLGGTNLRPGDQVLLVPVGTGEYVVAGVIANNNAQRAVISSVEIEANALRPHHIPNGTIPLAKLNENVPNVTEVGTIANSQANAVFTQRISNVNFVTLAAVEAITNPIADAVQLRATRTYVDQQLANKAGVAHGHQTGAITTPGGHDLQDVVIALKNLSRCTYQNRNNTQDPCRNMYNNVGGIT